MLGKVFKKNMRIKYFELKKRNEKFVWEKNYKKTKNKKTTINIIMVVWKWYKNKKLLFRMNLK